MKTPKDIKPVLSPNLRDRCSKGKYSVRSRWSLESGRCRLSFAFEMKVERHLADMRWHQNKAT